jgi:hypothetical protein
MSIYASNIASVCVCDRSHCSTTIEEGTGGVVHMCGAYRMRFGSFRFILPPQESLETGSFPPPQESGDAFLPLSLSPYSRFDGGE